MPCHIVELDVKKAFEYSLVENIQRQTLSAVEEAEAFKIYVADFGYGGISELARKIGKSPSYITKRIHLLDLPPTVIESITNRSLDPSLAEELHSIKDQSRQSELASLIVKRHLSLRKARGVLSQYKAGVEPENPDDDNWVSALAHRQKALDKLIVTLRIAMNNIGPVVSDNEDDWLIWEILMHHKNLVHGQIDLLIKEKRKLNNRLVAGMS
jgi:ParB family chromosome partitioning protein